MDDILIFSGQTKEQHHTIVVWVLDILHRHWLYLKAKKSTFGQPMVEYLSIILLEGHVEMDPIKVASVHDWPTLTSMTKVQSFVRFVNFYWWFIQDFSYVAKPLHQLTKKGEAWRWTEAEQETFEELEQLIMSTSMLVQPNQDVHFLLEMDASRYVKG